MISHPLAPHCLSHKVNAFKTVQLPMQRVNDQGSRVIFSQTPLSGAHWLLWFVPFSIQVVSVLD